MPNQDETYNLAVMFVNYSSQNFKQASLGLKFCFYQRMNFILPNRGGIVNL